MQNELSRCLGCGPSAGKLSAGILPWGFHAGLWLKVNSSLHSCLLPLTINSTAKASLTLVIFHLLNYFLLTFPEWPDVPDNWRQRPPEKGTKRLPAVSTVGTSGDGGRLLLGAGRLPPQSDPGTPALCRPVAPAVHRVPVVEGGPGTPEHRAAACHSPALSLINYYFLLIITPKSRH